MVGLAVIFGFVILSGAGSVFLHVVSFVCLMVMIIVVPLTTLQYVRLYLKKLPALSLTSAGFINYLVSPTLVPWTDVVDCSVANFSGLQPARLLVVGLKPGALDHLVMPWFLRMAYFHASLFFIGDNLDFPLDRLAEIFERYRKIAARNA
jgi:hypothetical protein